MEPKCTCPSFEGLSYEEILTVSGLLERKEKSRNCCETGGYICPNLDRALNKARNKPVYVSKTGKSRKGKYLKKKKLSL